MLEFERRNQDNPGLVFTNMKDFADDVAADEAQRKLVPLIASVPGYLAPTNPAGTYKTGYVWVYRKALTDEDIEFVVSEILRRRKHELGTLWHGAIGALEAVGCAECLRVPPEIEAIVKDLKPEYLDASSFSKVEASDLAGLVAALRKLIGKRAAQAADLPEPSRGEEAKVVSRDFGDSELVIRCSRFLGPASELGKQVRIAEKAIELIPDEDRKEGNFDEYLGKRILDTINELGMTPEEFAACDDPYAAYMNWIEVLSDVGAKPTPGKLDGLVIAEAEDEGETPAIVINLAELQSQYARQVRLSFRGK